MILNNLLLFIILGIIVYYIIIFITWIISNTSPFIGINYSYPSLIVDEKCGLNLLIRLFAPCILVVIISGIFYKFELDKYISNIYLIATFYYIYRIIIITLILQRKELQNWKYELLSAAFGTLFTYFIYCIFITKTSDIFIPIDELRNNIWFSIILFIFIIIRDSIYNISIDIDNDIKRKEKYYLKKYYKLKMKYGQLISMRNKVVAYLTYSIMIVENFNRPFVHRLFEYIKLLLFHNATIGIMQIKSNKLISDEDSIRIGYNKILKSYERLIKTKDEDYIRKIVLEYNDDTEYANNVCEIFEFFMEKDYKGLI